MGHITPCIKDGLLRFFEDGWQRSIRVESNTGLYKFGQRYYDTDLGRWTQMDPVGGTVGNPNSGNPYVYANDLPNMLVDPSGACTAYETIKALALSIAAGLILALAIAALPETALVSLSAFSTALFTTSAGGTIIASSIGAIFGAIDLGLCLGDVLAALNS